MFDVEYFTYGMLFGMVMGVCIRKPNKNKENKKQKNTAVNSVFRKCLKSYI